jgi:hypothetical protein
MIFGSKFEQRVLIDLKRDKLIPIELLLERLLLFGRVITFEGAHHFFFELFFRHDAESLYHLISRNVVQLDFWGWIYE